MKLKRYMVLFETERLKGRTFLHAANAYDAVETAEPTIWHLISTHVGGRGWVSFSPIRWRWWHPVCWLLWWSYG